MTGLLVRSAALSGYAELARSMGLDPAVLTRQVGLNLRSLSSPDHRIAAHKAYRLMEISAAASGDAHFGLRMATRRGLSHLGALGLLVRDEPTVRHALLRIAHNMELHSTCVVLQLQELRGLAVVELTVLSDGESAIRQAVEAGVGLLHQILTALLGTAWRPVHVQFVHDAPGIARPYRQFFGCPVGFGAEHNGIVLRSADLGRAVPGSDHGFRAYTRASTPPLAKHRGEPASQATRRLILQLLPDGQCSSQAIADRLGMDRRTLHRHLQHEGSAFSAILDDIRTELAAQYLKAGRLPMAEIAGLLGFSAASSFTRWHTHVHGRPPTARRTTTSKV